MSVRLRVDRRTGTLIAAAVLLAGLVIFLGIRAINTKDSPRDQSALRQRVDLLEADPLLTALLAVPHTTQSSYERLTCQAPNSWNLRQLERGNLDSTRVAAILADPSAYGWTATGATSYRKAIGPGVTATVAAAVSTGELVVTVNASAGLSCQPG